MKSIHRKVLTIRGLLINSKIRCLKMLQQTITLSVLEIVNSNQLVILNLTLKSIMASSSAKSEKHWGGPILFYSSNDNSAPSSIEKTMQTSKILKIQEKSLQ